VNDPISAAMRTGFSGLLAQSMRMKVVAENLANADSTGKTAGSDPYRRKTISFENALDSATGSETVAVGSVGRDRSAFRSEYSPGHPAADDKGIVKLPNVSVVVEMADMREAIRSYTANSQIIKQLREMTSMTIEMLRS